ncbi:MAG: transcriptional regulator [Deltaproteobacteria bacterium CG_4_10_14_0_2_um_filter_43_8]|nr:MAG: transcriptional regulator [Deltaproteobacteria bacterium CG11_big_fil_rev_8_21_14_0_20_42_23]PJA19490.1 MAG: transcriptional regulator [Deltaproteobacteria bacterium CG_4_10_14_0_2_um_filter_43_8]PJC63889.1 MAG: transcriptional regulator [Deltaproteobacteria bacterium CG_4_9_14_0_2_um_filter_42_21]
MEEKQLKKMKSQSKRASRLLKIMSHPERLMTLCHLLSKEMTVGDLLQLSHLSQSAFSQHLAALRKEKIVSTRKVAQKVYYRISRKEVKEIISALHKVYC